MKLRVAVIEMVSDESSSNRWNSFWIDVIEEKSARLSARWQECLPQFKMMAQTIMDDIQMPIAAELVMNGILMVESGLTELSNLDGNAWVIKITPNKVTFEGLYDQGEGGEVTLPQFKLAVQTYRQFLSDPEHQTIEVNFPESDIDSSS